MVLVGVGNVEFIHGRMLIIDQGSLMVFSQHDLETAERLASIETGVKNLNRKLDIFFDDTGTWKKDVETTLKSHSKFFNITVGVLATLQLAWVGFVAFFKGHN